MATAISTIYVGATGQNITITVLDQNGVPRNLTGGTVTLQGTSPDIGKQINAAGTLLDPVNGVAQWTSAGTLIAAGDLGSITQTTYTLQPKFVDSGGKKSWGTPFQCIFSLPLLGATA